MGSLNRKYIEDRMVNMGKDLVSLETKLTIDLNKETENIIYMEWEWVKDSTTYHFSSGITHTTYSNIVNFEIYLDSLMVGVTKYLH